MLVSSRGRATEVDKTETLSEFGTSLHLGERLWVNDMEMVRLILSSNLRFTLLRVIVLVGVLAFRIAASSEPPYPPWIHGEEIAAYAERANLPLTRTVELGDGTEMEFVLIPAGKFVMGTREPQPVNELHFRTQIWCGQTAVAVSCGVLLTLAIFVIVRSLRQKQRIQFSLSRLVVLAFIAGVGIFGGLHWRHSSAVFSRAHANYKAAVVRYALARQNEKPAHEVTIGRPFYIGKYEVTQKQFESVMGWNLSSTKGRSGLPVDRVPWAEAKAFCMKITTTTGVNVRLPTEAEWEYACRAGTTTVYSSGDTEADLSEVGWYCANSGSKTHPVGQKAANAWGVHDMHGNVWEYCEDDMHEDYRGAPRDGSAWIAEPRGRCRAQRGGSWNRDGKHARCAFRAWGDPVFGDGFRVVLDLGP